MWKWNGSEDGPPLALVFKIQSDREAGSLSLHQGLLGHVQERFDGLFNIDKKKRERINRLLRMHANRSEPVDSVSAGDIAVVIGFKLAQTGDTIGSEGYPVLLEPMTFPEPVITVAIEPQTLSERKKLKEVLDDARQKKIRPSSTRKTRKPASSSSRGWASCTSMFS